MNFYDLQKLQKELKEEVIRVELSNGKTILISSEDEIKGDLISVGTIDLMKNNGQKIKINSKYIVVACTMSIETARKMVGDDS